MGPHLTFAADRQVFSGSSVQSRLLELAIRRTVRPFIDLWAMSPVTVVPPNLLDQAARLLRTPRGTSWRSIETGRVKSDWICGDGVTAEPGSGRTKGPGTGRTKGPGTGRTKGPGGVILYFHGGAFFSCGLNTHRHLASRISAAAGLPVLNVGYRQMPSEPISEAIADGVEAFRWLVDAGYEPSEITVAGDSAGGYLAFAVARAVIDNAIGKPAAVIALSPLLDFDSSRKSQHRNARRCASFGPKAFERLTTIADKLDLGRGLAGQRTCPVDMPIDDMPPVLIQSGSREILLADAEHMADRLAAAGVPCELQVWERQVHVFQAASWVPEARDAVTEIGDFVQQLAVQLDEQATVQQATAS